MKTSTDLKRKYSELVRRGYYKTARRLLRAMINKSNSFYTVDYDDEAYESGLADWLQENYKWSNQRHGFTVYFK